MTKKIRTALLKLAKTLDKDFKIAYYHNQTLNNDYFLDQIKKICSHSSKTKRALSDILFNNNIMRQADLVKDMQVVTSGKVPSKKTSDIMVHAETLQAPLYIYPKHKATRYVKAVTENTVNLNAKDIGNILHKLL